MRGIRWAYPGDYLGEHTREWSLILKIKPLPLIFSNQTPFCQFYTVVAYILPGVNNILRTKENMTVFCVGNQEMKRQL